MKNIPDNLKFKLLHNHYKSISNGHNTERDFNQPTQDATSRIFQNQISSANKTQRGGSQKSKQMFNFQIDQAKSIQIKFLDQKQGGGNFAHSLGLSNRQLRKVQNGFHSLQEQSLSQTLNARQVRKFDLKKTLELMHAKQNVPQIKKGNNRYEDAETSPAVSNQQMQEHVYEAEQQNIMIDSLMKTRDSQKITSKATLMHQTSPGKQLSPPTIMTESFENLIKSTKQISTGPFCSKIKTKVKGSPQGSTPQISVQKKLSPDKLGTKQPSLAKIIQLEQKQEISSPTVKQKSRDMNKQSGIEFQFEHLSRKAIASVVRHPKIDVDLLHKNQTHNHSPDQEMVDSQLSQDNMLTENYEHYDSEYMGQTKFHPQIKYKNQSGQRRVINSKNVDNRVLTQSVDVTGESQIKITTQSNFLRNSVQDYEMAKIRQKKQSITAYQLVLNNQMFQDRTNQQKNSQSKGNRRLFNQTQDLEMPSKHLELQQKWKQQETILSPKGQSPKKLNASSGLGQNKVQSGEDAPFLNEMNYQHIDKIVIHARSTPSARQSPYTDQTSRNQSPQMAKNFEKKDILNLDLQKHENFSPKFSAKVKKPLSSVTSRNIESPSGNESPFNHQQFQRDFQQNKDLNLENNKFSTIPLKMIRTHDVASSSKNDVVFDIEQQHSTESQVLTGPEDPKVKEYVQMIENSSLKTSIHFQEQNELERANLAEKSRAFRKQFDKHEAVAKVISKIDKQFQNNKYKFQYTQKDPLDQILAQQEQIEKQKTAFQLKQSKIQKGFKTNPSTQALQSPAALVSKQFKFPEPKQTQQIYQSLKKNESKDLVSYNQKSGGNLKKDRKNESQISKQSIPQYNPHISLRSPRYYGTGKEDINHDSQSEIGLKFAQTTKAVENLPALTANLKIKFKREDYVWSSTSKERQRGRDAIILSNPSFGQIAQKIMPPNNDLNDIGTPRHIQGFFNCSLWNSTQQQMQQNVIESQNSRVFSRGQKRFGNSSYRLQSSQQNSPRVKVSENLQIDTSKTKNEKLALNQINKIFEATVSPKFKRTSINQSLAQTQNSFEIKNLSKLDQQFIDYSLTNNSEFLLQNLDNMTIKDYQKTRSIESSVISDLTKRGIEQFINSNTSVLPSKKSGVSQLMSPGENPIFQKMQQTTLEPKGPKFSIGKLMGNNTVQKHIALNHLSQSMDFQSFLRDSNQSSNFESNKCRDIRGLNHSMDLGEHLKDLRKNQLQPLLAQNSKQMPKTLVNSQLDAIQIAAEKKVQADIYITERLIDSKIDIVVPNANLPNTIKDRTKNNTKIHELISIQEPYLHIQTESSDQRPQIPKLNLNSQSMSVQKSDQRKKSPCHQQYLKTNRAQHDYLKFVNPSSQDHDVCTLNQNPFVDYSSKDILYEGKTQNFNQQRVNTSTGDRHLTRNSDSGSLEKEVSKKLDYKKTIDLQNGTNIEIQKFSNSNQIQFAVKIEEQTDNTKQESKQISVHTSESKRKQFQNRETKTLKMDGSVIGVSDKSSTIVGREISCQLALDSIDDELPMNESQVRISPKSPLDNVQNNLKNNYNERRKVIHQRKGTQQLLNIKEQNLKSENTTSSLGSPTHPEPCIQFRQNQILPQPLSTQRNGDSYTQHTSIVQNTENQSIDPTQNMTESANGRYNKFEQFAIISKPTSPNRQKESYQVNSHEASRIDDNQLDQNMNSVSPQRLGKKNSKLNVWSPNQTDHNISGVLDQELLREASLENNQNPILQNHELIQERDSEFSGSPQLMNKALYGSNSVVTSVKVLKKPEQTVDQKIQIKNDKAKQKFYTMQRNGLPIMQDVQIMPNQVIYNFQDNPDQQTTQKTLSKNLEHSMLKNNDQIKDESLDSLIMKQVNSMSSYNKSSREDSKSPRNQKNTTVTKAYYARQRCYDQPNLFYRQDPRQMQGRVQVNLTTLSKTKWAEYDDRSTQTQIFQSSQSPRKIPPQDSNGLEHNFVDFNELKLIGQNKKLEDKKAKVRLENQAQLTSQTHQNQYLPQKPFDNSFMLETSNLFQLDNNPQQPETDRYDTGLFEYPTMNTMNQQHQRPFSLAQNSRLLTQKYDSPLGTEGIGNNRSDNIKSPSDDGSAQKLKGKSIDYPTRQSIRN